MTAILALYWDRLPDGDTPNKVLEYALWPSPVDHDACFQEAGFDEFADTDDDWDKQWLDIIIRAVEYLKRYGSPSITQAAGDEERPACWQRILVWWQQLRGTLRITLASTLPIPEQLALASQHDQFGPCIVSFGDVVIRTDSGHPILWIECREQTTFDAHDMAVACVIGRPVSRRVLDWWQLRSD